MTLITSKSGWWMRFPMNCGSGPPQRLSSSAQPYTPSHLHRCYRVEIQSIVLSAIAYHRLLGARHAKNYTAGSMPSPTIAHHPPPVSLPLPSLPTIVGIYHRCRCPSKTQRDTRNGLQRKVTIQQFLSYRTTSRQEMYVFCSSLQYSLLKKILMS